MQDRYQSIHDQFVDACIMTHEYYRRNNYKSFMEFLTDTFFLQVTLLD